MARISLTRSIKFRRLVAALPDVPEQHLRGYLEYLWESCYESATGVVGTQSTVELLSGWKGAPGRFAQALEDTGFLDRDDRNILSCHDFWEHAPDYVRLRRRRSEERRQSLYNRERPTLRREMADHPPRPVPSQPVSLSSFGEDEKATAPDKPVFQTPGPRLHQNPPAEIDALLDYAIEVLNKLDGAPANADRKDHGSLLLAACHVPGSLIRRALMDTQDTKHRGTLKEPGAYFTERIKSLCASAKIQSPYGREKKQEVKANA